VCICSLRYSACSAQAPYCHLWLSPLYNIFPRFLIIGTIFEKKNVTGHKMCVLIFSTNFACTISHSKNKWASYDKKCVWFFMYSTVYSCPILMKPAFYRQIFEWHSDIKFLENPPVGAELFYVDRRTDMTMLIVAFRNFANAPKYHE
jgi:hypothetical protein